MDIFLPLDQGPLDSGHIWKKMQYHVFMLNPGKTSERAPLNSIRLFALQPLVNDGFDRFRNLLKVEAKTTQQICLCHLGHKPKVCLLTAKLGVQLKQKLKKSFLFTENSQRSQLSGLKPADKGAMSDA